MRFKLALAFWVVFSSTGFAAVSSPVADAAMSGDKIAVRSLLEKKADVNAPQADGATAIQWAAYKNDLEMADLLIKAGANVKAANHEGATALYLSSIRGSAPMLDKLLPKGNCRALEVDERGPERRHAAHAGSSQRPGGRDQGAAGS